jgi:hypothetical protein
MNLVEKIILIHPSLSASDLPKFALLQNDSDGLGDYIKEWNHPTLPRPTDEQLAALQ